MRSRKLLANGLVVVGCIAGGALECSSRPPLSAVEQQGGDLYGRMCSVCHGASGEGYRADQAPAIGHPEFLASVSDDFLRRAIVHGRAKSTMSAWGVERGGPLAREDVNGIVAFIRSWYRGKPRKLDERRLSGDAKRGADVFSRECVKCHGADGTGGPNVQIGARELLTTASNGFLRHAIRTGRSGTPMPGFTEALGDPGIEDLVAYLRDVQAKAQPPPAAHPAPVRPPPIPLGPVPLNPKGPDPVGFKVHPETTKSDVVHRELKRGAKMALLDARAPTDYTNEHIEGAVSVPFYDPSPYLQALPKNVWLVSYCSCPHAESRMLAAALVAGGFKKVTVLDEGLGVWKMKGYGTRTGLEP